MTRLPAARVTARLDTHWDFDYEPTLADLTILYETAKRQQWDASTAIDWSRPLAATDAVFDPRLFSGDFHALAPEVRRESERRLAAWRLSQFLHGEQGALVVASQLVNCLPTCDAKLYAATQVGDEGRHVDVFRRYVNQVGRIYPVDPALRSVMDEILAAEGWELKLLGMQMIVEGVAIAAFNLMRRQAADPVLGRLLDLVLRDESRHVNFGYLALRQAIPAADPTVRDALEDFAFHVCDALYERDGHGGFRSVRVVWEEMGADASAAAGGPTVRFFNQLLFTQFLLPRLTRLGLLSPRIVPRYQAAGLLGGETVPAVP